jgi:hypothetical protein
MRLTKGVGRHALHRGSEGPCALKPYRLVVRLSAAGGLQRHDPVGDASAAQHHVERPAAEA